MEISPLLKDDETYDNVVLLFPAEDAIDVNSMSHEDLEKIKRVVLIDSTWN